MRELMKAVGSFFHALTIAQYADVQWPECLVVIADPEGKGVGGMTERLLIIKADGNTNGEYGGNGLGGGMTHRNGDGRGDSFTPGRGWGDNERWEQYGFSPYARKDASGWDGIGGEGYGYSHPWCGFARCEQHR